MAEMPLLGLEIPAFGALAALRVATLGATRIELNALGSYGEGGLTPSLEDLKQFISASAQRCPLRIMIRPRGVASSPAEAGGLSERDFLYNAEEFDIMEAGIKEFKGLGLLDANKGDGFVFGILEEDELEEYEGHIRRQRCRVDKARCTRLVQTARPFKCVFHRAFDEIVSCDTPALAEPTRPSWETGLEDLAACGFDGILTSGGLGKAINNIEMLEKIIQKAQALQIETVVGGGVRTANIGEITQRLGLWMRANSVYLHSACLRGNVSEDISPEEVQGILAQLE
ncbi:copper homeostasis protein cutC [Xylaria flabelliformis]|nr:copper homeostasis protein cutC [Xylaria flabelliformis]